MTIRASQTLLGVKIEATAGTDSVPAVANALLVSNWSLDPLKGDQAPRAIGLPYMGNVETIPVGLHGVMSFDCEGHSTAGAGVAPAWDPLVRSAGAGRTVVATTSVTYNPAEPPHETCSIYFWVGGHKYMMVYCAATGVWSLDSKGVPKWRWTVTGLVVPATDEAMPALAAATAINQQLDNAPLPGSSANTPVFSINAIPLALQSFSLDLGVTVEPRHLIRDERVLITGKAEKCDVKVGAVALSTFNPMNRAQAGDTTSLTLQHGSAAGSRLTWQMSQAQMELPRSPEVMQDLLMWPLSVRPLPRGPGANAWSLLLN